MCHVKLPGHDVLTYVNVYTPKPNSCRLGQFYDVRNFVLR